METFHWPVCPEMEVTSAPRTITVKLGDGYEQRRMAGLNTDLKKFDVTLRVKRQDALALEAFLIRHRGVTAFLWTAPYQYKTLRVVCRKWKSRVGGLRVVFTATFEQVVF
ncbi:phage tail protein [Salmonella enterica subsp. enterica serovar Louisiana]|nr:phage tail protein [Salmonella enterica subsp. enterica serovar Louisiana]ECA5248513.1 phage tail protein [Salmonella enterica subsp. enterica serovar Lomalinda]ECD3926752.1 phage tail protein [Salmonella enterica subsp. enterica serovar Wangata]EDV1505005.1 phage tail protein [Salmonella enterica subsp. salamae]EEI9681219.1 phage tail protein [Salmonella enterica]